MSDLEPQDAHTRLKFERYVFFAFFAAMVMVVIAGIIGIKRTQQSLEDEQQEAARQRDINSGMRERLNSERESAARAEQDLRKRIEQAEDREAMRARGLGAALTQLALADSNGPPAARTRARQLLDEAQRLGAPAYLDLARWALFDASSAGMAPIERTPFTCAALSRDGRLLALGRGEGGIDLYLLETGRKLAHWTNPEGAGEATALEFSARALFAGYRGAQLAQIPLGADGVFGSEVQAIAKLPATLRQLSVSESGKFGAALDAANNIRVWSLESPERPVVEARSDLPLLAVAAMDDAEFPAVSLDAQSQITRYGTGGERRLLRKAASGESVAGALRIIAGSVACAVYGKEVRRLTANGDNSANFALSADLPSHMAFAPDGALLIGDAFGRYTEAFEFEPGEGLAPWVSLGSDAPIRFLARTDSSIVAVSADGTVSIRRDPDAWLFGRRILRTSARAWPSSLGFSVQRSGLVWPVETGRWLASASDAQLAPARSGFAAFANGRVWLDNGAQCSAETLLCALASGGALVRGVTGEVGVLGRDGTLLNFTALARLAPDVVYSSARSDAVLARTGNVAWVIRLENGATTREFFAPGMPMIGAIDERGRRIALPERDIIRIVNLEGEGESQASPRAELAALAFLFDGTVLCALEGKELAFYDSTTGRQLLRRATTATQMAGSDNRLFLVCPEALRVLQFR